MGGCIDVESPLAGQLVGEPVRGVHEPVRPVPDLSFVLAQPGCLEGVPFRGRGKGPVSGVTASGRVGVDHPGRLLGGSDVHPHDGVAQSLAVLVEGHDRHGGGIVGDPRYFVGLQSRALHHQPGGCHECLPPVVRGLLGPAGSRVRGLVRGRREGDRRAHEIKDSDPARFGTEVDSHDIRAAGEGVGVLEDGQ